MNQHTPAASLGNDKIGLWNAVAKTDPAFTKPFSRGGGFKGTATNATYLAKKATEQFGPCGLGWGVKVLDERILDGADGEKVHRVHIQLWYMLAGQRAEIEHFGQTTFVGKNKHGAYTDEEAPKKSLTDAMTKALSLLGFAADIHMGLYDDNKYVESIKDEIAETRSQEEIEARARRDATTVTNLKRTLDWLDSIEKLKGFMVNPETEAKLDALPEVLRNEVVAHYRARAKTLIQSESAGGAGSAAEGAGAVESGMGAAAPASTILTGKDDEVSLDELIKDLHERLGFANTIDELEAAYDDFGGDGLFSGYDDGIKQAQALKRQHALRMPQDAPAKAQEAREPQSGGGQPATAERPSTGSAGDPFAMPSGGFSGLRGYREWIEAAVKAAVDEPTAKRLMNAWFRTSDYRDSLGLSQPDREALRDIVAPTLRRWKMFK